MTIISYPSICTNTLSRLLMTMTMLTALSTNSYRKRKSSGWNSHDRINYLYYNHFQSIRVDIEYHLYLYHIENDWTMVNRNENIVNHRNLLSMIHDNERKILFYLMMNQLFENHTMKNSVKLMIELLLTLLILFHYLQKVDHRNFYH